MGAIDATPSGSTIIAACDDDQAGDDYNALIRRLTPYDRISAVEVPPGGHNDWNEALRHHRTIEKGGTSIAGPDNGHQPRPRR